MTVDRESMRAVAAAAARVLQPDSGFPQVSAVAEGIRNRLSASIDRTHAMLTRQSPGLSARNTSAVSSGPRGVRTAALDTP